MAYGGFGFQDKTSANSRIGNLKTGLPENFGLLQNIEQLQKETKDWLIQADTWVEHGLETPSSTTSERNAAHFPWNSVGSSPAPGMSSRCASNVPSPGEFSMLTPAKSVGSGTGIVKLNQADWKSAMKLDFGSPPALAPCNMNNHTSLFPKSPVQFMSTTKNSPERILRSKYAPGAFRNLGSQESATSLSEWSVSSEDTAGFGRPSYVRKSEYVDQKMQWNLTGFNQVIRESFTPNNNFGSFGEIGLTSEELEFNNLRVDAVQELYSIEEIRVGIAKHLGYNPTEHPCVHVSNSNAHHQLLFLLDFSDKQLSELENLSKVLRIGENKGAEKMKREWASLNSTGVGVQLVEPPGRALSPKERKARGLLREIPKRMEGCRTLTMLIRRGRLRDSGFSEEQLKLGSINSLLKKLKDSFVHIKTLLLAVLNDIEPGSFSVPPARVSRNNFVEETEERGALRNTRFPASRKQLIPKALSASGRRNNDHK